MKRLARFAFLVGGTVTAWAGAACTDLGHAPWADRAGRESDAASAEAGPMTPAGRSSLGVPSSEASWQPLRRLAGQWGDGSDTDPFDGELSPRARISADPTFSGPLPSTWPTGVVPYTFADSITEIEKVQLLRAADEWAAHGQLRFVERTSQPDYVLVTRDGRYNNAAIGITGGVQYLRLATWSHPMLVHELGHTVGFNHEHQRPDRDTYVEVHEQNILPDKVADLVPKRPHPMCGPYNFTSIMHYRPYSGSANGLPVLTPRLGFEAFLGRTGNTRGVTAGDQHAVASLYGSRLVHIPDPSFKAYLVGRFDSSGDGELDTREASLVGRIETPGNGSIADLTGVEQLLGLKELICANEALTGLPSLPPDLQVLRCSGNRISEVPAPPWPESLGEVDLTDNELGVSACPEIMALESTGIADLRVSPQQQGALLDCTTQGVLPLNPRTQVDIMASPAGAQITYSFSIPPGARNLLIELDDRDDREADLYARSGSRPSLTVYDERFVGTGMGGSIGIADPLPGLWLVMVHAREGVGDKRLQVRFSPDSLMKVVHRLGNGEVAVDSGSALPDLFTLDVPAVTDRLYVATDGGTGNADLYVRHEAEPTRQDYDYRSAQPSNAERVTVFHPIPGHWYVRLLGSDFSDAKLIGYWRPQPGNLPAGTGVTMLYNAVPVTDLAASGRAELRYAIQVPQGAHDLTIELGGGQGDADLYVRRGQMPTKNEYDYRPYLSGCDEVVRIALPTPGPWYVTVHAYQSFSGVALVASYEAADSASQDRVLQNGVPKTGLAGVQGAMLYFLFEVPEGAAGATFLASGGTGDADIYVRYAQEATLEHYDYRPYRSGSDETVRVAEPQRGTWHVMLHAYRPFDDVSLLAMYEGAAGTSEPPAEAYENHNDYPIPDASAAGVSSPIEVPRSGEAGALRVDVQVTHGYIGDLVIKLTAPGGVSAVLHNREGGATANLNRSWTLDASGVGAAGVWLLQAKDLARSDTGFIDGWSLTFR